MDETLNTVSTSGASSSPAQKAMDPLESVMARMSNLEKDLAETRIELAKLKQQTGTVSDVGTRDVMDVAFSVSLSKHLHILGTGQTIKFDDVITNLGSGYCPVTGVFTCPVDGIYVFVATIMCHSGKCNELQLMMNGVRKMLVYTAGHSHPNQSSNSVVLQLNKSDRLWIETHGYPSPSSVYGGNWSSFTGVKIK